MKGEWKKLDGFHFEAWRFMSGGLPIGSVTETVEGLYRGIADGLYLDSLPTVDAAKAAVEARLARVAT